MSWTKEPDAEVPNEEAMQQAILDFWFRAPDNAQHGKTRAEWFRKDKTFDTEIRDRFGTAVEQALSGHFADWDTPRGRLARVLLLDQFTRNSFRDSPRAFAGDPLALVIAEKVVDGGHDRDLLAVERWFLYMPFVHAESMFAQQRSLALFTRLRDETGLAEPLEWAQRHVAVIRRFGRFPHRNTILGRKSTPEEEAFLASPGSRF